VVSIDRGPRGRCNPRIWRREALAEPVGGRLSRPPTVRARYVCLAVVVSIVSVGCSPSSQIADLDTVYGEYPLTDMAAESDLLLALLAVREDEFVAGCMREEGFSYTPASAGFSDAGRSIEPPELTVERARVYGYQWPELPEAEPNGSGNMPPIGNSEDDALHAWGEALQGAGDDMASIELSFGLLSIPRDGCRGEARAWVAGDIETYLGWVAALGEIDGLRNQSISRTEADPLVMDVLDRWRVCMRAEGFDVNEIYEAPSLAWSKDVVQPTDGQHIAPPSDWEIGVAVADATCRDSSGYRIVRAERFSYHQNIVLGDNEQVLFVWSEQREELHRILADLIATAG